VTLDTQNNDVDRLSISTGGVAKFKDVDDLTLATITADSGSFFTATSGVSGTVSVALTSTGLTQNASNPINAGAGTVLIDANDGAISLGSSITTTNTTSSAVGSSMGRRQRWVELRSGAAGAWCWARRVETTCREYHATNGVISATELSINGGGSATLSGTMHLGRCWRRR